MKRVFAIFSACMWLGFSAIHGAPQPEAVSISNGSGVTADGSFGPHFSADGRFLLFASDAKNLTTNTDVSLNINLFSYNVLSGETALISAALNNAGRGNGNSAFYSLSSNGQLVAFASAADNLISNDTNSAADIFARDVANRSTRLVSVNNSGAGTVRDPSPNSSPPLSSNPEISLDGRWVVFESRSIELSPNAVSSNMNVFARDLLANGNLLVSVTVSGTAPDQRFESHSPHLSADGNFVAFVSTATDLVPEGTAPTENLFRRDLQQQTTVCVSRELPQFLGFFTNEYTIVDHSMSGDGQIVAFKVRHLYQRLSWVFRYDVSAGSVLLLSSNSYYRSTPQLSREGSYLAYEDGTNVLIWDHLMQTNSAVSVEGNGTHLAAGISHSPAMSDDGRYVAFLSNGGDLVTNKANGQFQVFWRDLWTATTRLVSRNTNGVAAAANHELIVPSISRDGSLVAFESSASDLVADDLNQTSDVFVFDPNQDSLSLVSKAHPARPAITRPNSSGIARNIISADGAVIAYFGFENHGPTNTSSDIFIRDFVIGETGTISVVTNALLDPEVSADGRYITYIRRNRATSLDFHDDVLRYDRATGLSAQATTGDIYSVGSPVTHATSSNGQFVAFDTFDTMDPRDTSGGNDIYLHDFISDSNTLITVRPDGSVGGGEAPTLSPDDKNLFFFSRTLVNDGSGLRRLFLKRLDQSSAPLLVSHQPGSSLALPASASALAISGDSQKAVFGADLQLYHYDIRSNVASFICTNCQNGSLNQDGQLLAYEMREANVRYPRQVWLRDLQTGQATLLSNPSDLGFASQAVLDSWSRVVTGNGRFVLFISRPYTPDTNVARLYCRDRALNQTLLLTPNPEGLGLLKATGAQLAVSRDGRTAVFRSFASDLVAGDYNDKQDVFVLRLGSGDSDGDGMDDDWEMAYFNTLSRDGSGDFGGDGKTDLEEFRAGTDPSNRDSVLRVITLTRSGGGTTIFWNAVLGRSYRVEFKDSVEAPGWSTVSGQVQISGSTAWIDDQSAASAGRRFYRVVAIR